MKREFGKPLIEDYFKSVDLVTVIDSSGAFIPGHATPTVILFGRNRKPVSEHVRAVLGKQAEPTTPDPPSAGLVWSSILSVIDAPNTETAFVGAKDLLRSRLLKHPWNLEGGECQH